MAKDDAPKVVKRVVKKPTAPPSGSEPVVRYGRPVAPKAAPATRPKKGRRGPSTQQPGTSGPDANDTGSTLVEDSPANEPRAPRTSVRRPAVPKVDLHGTKERLGDAGAGAAAAVRRVWTALVHAFWWVVDGVRSWRLPILDPVPASLFTGIITGLVSVVLGLGALQLFGWLRGVASGGGTWGTLTFVVVAFIAFVIGELLLSGFGAPSPRLTSFLGVTLTIVVLLAVYLEESDTRMALLIVPSVAATAFTFGHWLMAAAESGADSEE